MKCPRDRLLFALFPAVRAEVFRLLFTDRRGDFTADSCQSKAGWRTELSSAN